MSTDARVTNDLIQTLKDGQEGFTTAADRLRDSDRADLGARFAQFAAQRELFAAELQTMAATYGDQPEKSGSVAGALHRGWMAMKDKLAGSGSSEGVLDAAEQGEDHAVSEYKKALAADISPTLRAVLERQFTEVKTAHQVVRSARDAEKAP